MDKSRDQTSHGQKPVNKSPFDQALLDPDSFARLFMERKSVRVYEDRPVEDPVRQQVLAATMRAPTAGNMMLYSILEISDPALKLRLSETCDHQPFIAAAPWVLVFLADYARMMAWFSEEEVPGWCVRRGESMQKPREADLLLAACDALIAAQTAATAAQALGLGSCYIGDVMEQWETHVALLGLPRYTFPITMLCLGYPTEQQLARPQPERLPSDIVIQENRYRMPSKEELEALYRDRSTPATAPAKPGDSPTRGQALYQRKFGAVFSVEMRRSVSRMLEEWR